MADLAEKRARFSRKMSSNDLIEWLHVRGLGDQDREKIREEEFTGESFLLLDVETMKELGIKRGGQILLKKLLVEASESDADVVVKNPIYHPPTLPAATPNNVIPSPSTLLPGFVTPSMPGTVAPSTMMPVSSTVGSNAMTPSTVIINQFTPDANPSSTAAPQQQNDLSDANRVLENEDTNEDGLRVEEDSVSNHIQVPPYCSTGPYEGSSVFSYDHTVYMYRDKVWVDRQVLRVFFMNPDILVGWGLDTDTILEWTEAWACCENEMIPTFEKTTVVDKADIRVKFSETEGCWSMVGMDAEKIDKDNPTMILNLEGCSEQFQRSLVIHEFGHALGLDHEHQRSDFIPRVVKYFDIPRIPSSQLVRVRKKDDVPEKEGVRPYDPDSIMHYWFDVQWLKPRYRIMRNIIVDNGLGPLEKQYLRGLHKRQGDTMLPAKPSRSDLEQLHRAYVDFEPKKMPSARPPRPMMSDFFSSQSVDTVAAPTNPYAYHQLTTMGSSFEVEQETNSVILRVDDHLRAILNAVWDARSHWRGIGRGLEFSEHELNALNGNVGAKLESLLSSWIHRGNATIDQLLAALRSNLVRRSDLANNIERTRSHAERRELGLE